MAGDSTPAIPSQERESESLLKRVEKKRDLYESAVERHGKDSPKAISALRSAQRSTIRAFDACEVLFDCPAYEDLHSIGSELGLEFGRQES